MSAADLATTTAFLRYVHEHAIDAGIAGRVVISMRMPPGVSPRYKSRAYRLDQLDAAAEGAQRISRSEENGYCRVHLMERDLDRVSERGDTPGQRTEGDAEISGQQITHDSSAPPSGLCWLACGVLRCACCPLASEVAK